MHFGARDLLSDLFHPFHVTGLFLFPLKTSESCWLSDISGGEIGGMKWVKQFLSKI